jgi:integrase
MATISKRGNGCWYVRFTNVLGKRATVALGTRSERLATGSKLHIENILSARRAGHAVDPATAAWIATLSSQMRERLERSAVLEAQQPVETAPAMTVGRLVDRYFSKRSDVKSGTKKVWRHVKRNLVDFFGADREISSITAGDAKDFERWLRTGSARKNRYRDAMIKDGLEPDTARKRIAVTKQIFSDAVDREWIPRNPFVKLKTTKVINRTRDYLVTREQAAEVLEACPDNEWRLLFALSRFGGLRCPSEHLALTWDDVDWERSRIRVRSPKTEHHEGKAERIIPLFPELRPYLQAAWDAAEPGTEFVIIRYRDRNSNLRTMLNRIIRRAGLSPWPKLFQNLRSTRATELAAEYPGHVAAEWMGHSTLIAQKHYWQVTDHDFDRASGASAAALQKRSSKAPQPTDSAVSVAASAATTRNKPQQHTHLVAAEGLEPPTRGL